MEQTSSRNKYYSNHDKNGTYAFYPLSTTHKKNEIKYNLYKN